MNDFTLVSGSKNYSSWSMRAGLMLAWTGVPFEEIVIHLDQPDTRQRILEHSPAGKVPILKTGDVTVWDSLAISETLAEWFPDMGLWPVDAAARAHARAVSSEVHAGFAALRQEMPLNVRAEGRTVPITDAVSADIGRIQDIWIDCRERFGGAGDGGLLFGEFTIADAMFAPVVSRFRTYGVEVNSPARAYMDAVWNLSIVRTWHDAAMAEDYISNVYEIG
jgi:glutathione S-transferase